MRAARLIVSDVFRVALVAVGVVSTNGRHWPRYKARPCGGYGKPGTDYYRYSFRRPGKPGNPELRHIFQPLQRD